MNCPDGLLPDGPICPKCGGVRGPSGIGGGTWVHTRLANIHAFPDMSFPIKQCGCGSTDLMYTFPAHAGPFDTPHSIHCKACGKTVKETSIEECARKWLKAQELGI